MKKSFLYTSIITAMLANSAVMAQSVDSDSDGVEDAFDACPGTPINRGTTTNYINQFLAYVDEVGCRYVIDDDFDGVRDYMDECLDTPHFTEDSIASRVDLYGCTAINTARVEAEDYTAHYDKDWGNKGSVYREDSVDIEVTSDEEGGHNIFWVEDGEWLEYDLELTAATYQITPRVASETGGGSFSMWLDGKFIGRHDVTATGGWQTWESQASNLVSMDSGVHKLRIQFEGGGVNLNYIDFTGSGGVQMSFMDEDRDGLADYTEDRCVRTNNHQDIDWQGCDSESTASYFRFVEKIQAEDFESAQGVGIEPTTDLREGNNVGFIDAGDWMQYHTVTIPKAGTYQFLFKIASGNPEGGVIQIETAGGEEVLGTLTVPHTNGWQAWKREFVNVELEAGEYRFALKALDGNFNINWFSIIDFNY